MKSLIAVLAVFLFTGPTFAEINEGYKHPTQAYKGPDPINKVKRFLCHDVEIEKVNFEFCSKENPRMHGNEKTWDAKMKNVDRMQNDRYLKYRDCYIQVKERGRSKRFYDIVDTKPECSPKDTTVAFCETPEDTVRLNGPKCNGTMSPSESCSFSLHHKFDSENVDPDYLAYDSRRLCQCRDKGCGHVITQLQHPDMKAFTNAEKTNQIEQIKKAFKAKVPQCDDIIFKDVSAKENNIHMYIAMSSAKCPIINEPIIQDQHCPPWKKRAVERIEIERVNGKKIVVAAVCLKLPEDPQKQPVNEKARR